MNINPKTNWVWINQYLNGYAIWPYAALTLSMLFFASNQILGKLIPGEVPPIGLSFWRWVVAALLILPFTWRGLREHAALIWFHSRLFVFLTFVLVILGNTTIYIALNYTTAINAGVVAMAQPAVTTLLTWLFFKETMTKGQTIGALIAASGVLLLILRGNILALGNITFNVGDIWMLASVFGFACYAVFLGQSPKKIPPLVLLNILQILGILLLLPIYLWETYYVMSMKLNYITLVSVLWAGVIVAVAALGLWNYGNQTVGANKASAFVYVRLLFITVLAMIILDEVLQPYHVPAFICIVLGVYLVSKAKRKIPNLGGKSGRLQ